MPLTLFLLWGLLQGVWGPSHPRQRGDGGGEEPLLPSTKMFVLNTNVFWLWETVHVQVPLSCNSSWDSERLWTPLLLLFPGPFHCTEGLLPEGLSKVRVRLCPCSRWMLVLLVLLLLLLPLGSTLAVTVERSRPPVSHTHYPQGEGRPGTKSVSPSPLLTPVGPTPPPPTQGRVSSFSSSPSLSSVASLPPSSAPCPFPPPTRFLPLPLPDPRPEEDLRRCGGQSDPSLDC